MIILTIFIGLICGLLWSYAGAEGTSKLYRRLGVSLILSVVSCLVLKNYWCLTVLPLLWGATALGYGIPTHDDEGGTIGKFWNKIFKDGDDGILTRIFTRLTVGIAYAVSFISIPLIVGNWIKFIIYSSVIISSSVLFGALIKREGTFKLFNKNLLVEEFLIGFSVGICSILML